MRSTKGHPYPDDFLDYAKGYIALDRASRDRDKLYYEINQIKLSLFPFKSLRKQTKYFQIFHETKKINDDLNEHFVNDAYNSIYSDGGLDDFLAGIAYQLLIHKHLYYSIDWESRQINGQEYILPVRFHNLDEVTMSYKKRTHIYKQKYSLITYYTSHNFKYNEYKKNRITLFKNEDVLHCVYPFSKVVPTKKSMRLMQKSLLYSKFLLNQGAAHTKQESSYWPLEKTKLKNNSLEKRKYDLLRAKINKNFNLVLTRIGVPITEYYEAYTWIKYKKFLNDMREYLVKEFNKQILMYTALKNNISTVPILKTTVFITNDELDYLWTIYKSGEITIHELVDLSS